MKIHKRDRTLSFLVLIILSVSFFGIFSIPILHKATGVSPQFTRLSTSFQAGSNTAILANAWNPSSYINDTYLFVYVCDCPTSGSIPTITSITDTVGNNWIKAINLTGGNNGIGDGSSGKIRIEAEYWYASEISTGAGTITVTAHLPTTITYSAFAVFVTNQQVAFNSLVVGSSGFSSLSNPLGTVPLLAVKQASNVLQFTGTVQYIVFNLGFSTTNFGVNNFVKFAGSAPLVDNSADVFCNGNNNEIQCGSSQTDISPSGGTQNLNFYQLATSQIHQTEVYSYGMITIAFATVNVVPASCISCNIAGGGDKDSTTTFTLTGNVTYLYLADSSLGGSTIANITTMVSSYVNAGAGKSLDFIYLCFYTLPTLMSNLSISSSNPLSQKACFLDPNVSNGQVDQSIVWKHGLGNSGTFTVPSQVTFAWSIFSRFSGLSIYGTKTTVTMYKDSADYTGTLGTPPINLGNAVTTTPLFLKMVGVSQSSVFTSTGTFTVTNSSSTLTTTTLIPSITTLNTYTYVQNTQASKVSTFQDFITYFPVYILPLILSPFGIQGILVGLGLGITLGTLLGLIPIYAAFLIALGIIFVLNRR